MKKDPILARINNLFPRRFKFVSYYKYEFFFEDEDMDEQFKISASYGGDSDIIYRFSVSPEDRVTCDSLEDMKMQFTSIQVHNYTNELIYSWNSEFDD